MKYQNISDIYRENDKIRARLREILADLSDEQADLLPEGETWTIANIVEHLSIVEEGMMRISAKLLAKEKAIGQASDGRAHFSEGFLEKTAAIREQKLEAPELARPTGERRIPDSLARMASNRQKLEEMRPLFETVACTGVKFPHPYLGGLNANEWLALIGGHELRHIKQIERLLEKMK